MRTFSFFSSFLKYSLFMFFLNNFLLENTSPDFIYTSNRRFFEYLEEGYAKRKNIYLHIYDVLIKNWLKLIIIHQQSKRYNKQLHNNKWHTTHLKNIISRLARYIFFTPGADQRKKNSEKQKLCRICEWKANFEE